jgi:hypothetical protein
MTVLVPLALMLPVVPLAAKTSDKDSKPGRQTYVAAEPNTQGSEQ